MVVGDTLHLVCSLKQLTVHFMSFATTYYSCQICNLMKATMWEPSLPVPKAPYVVYFISHGCILLVRNDFCILFSLMEDSLKRILLKVNLNKLFLTQEYQGGYVPLAAFGFSKALTVSSSTHPDTNVQTQMFTVLTWQPNTVGENCLKCWMYWFKADVSSERFPSYLEGGKLLAC